MELLTVPLIFSFEPVSRIRSHPPLIFLDTLKCLLLRLGKLHIP